MLDSEIGRGTGNRVGDGLGVDGVKRVGSDIDVTDDEAHRKMPCRVNLLARQCVHDV